jgi:glutathione S-transferase
MLLCLKEGNNGATRRERYQDSRSARLERLARLSLFAFLLLSEAAIIYESQGTKWESHIIDLFTNENLSEWYLGINPRGLVPALVHDGAVYIESNDIVVYLQGNQSSSQPGLNANWRRY